ncbi:MAG TPA: VTT domain-containing protein [Pararhodobacter sp.]|uniref:bifunctional DedA family/phosphatase PAP2 family protein n=1 Tax=Pararhodobacter sp. TaxID=2127056 RepID=UPI002C9687D8|nr:VTT domain-containing protein [Pararhodobacter sp.]HPD92752.1 VTT domain-containing protein [Pararhodobacter sp.]
MFPSIDQILPSLQAFGVFGYWLIGLASALEAFFLTGVIVPGTLIVDAGGLLVQQGLMDFFDLAWFVALGSVLGSELSYWTGRLALQRIPGRARIEGSAVFRRAQALFERRGGLALVLGRFLGPVAGLVPLAAAMAGMERRRFFLWNLAGSVPYALAHVGLGYAMGDAAGLLGNTLGRAALVGALAVAVLAVLWVLLFAALRLLPLAVTILGVAGRALAARPPVARLVAAHPRTTAWLAARVSRHAFTGLPLTLLGALFLYIAAVWLGTVVDFLSGDPILQVDARLAAWIHTLQASQPVRVATAFTALGSAKVVAPLSLAMLIWLLLRRQIALAAGLAISVGGSAAAIALLKLVFQRPRSPLGYYLETSNSFPSGHAGSSIAAFGMMAFVLWRLGRLRAETALLGAGMLALAIGGSRVYLIEHYLSDVLSGWLVGALALVLGIAVSEWMAERVPSRPALPFGWRSLAGHAAVVALIGLAAFEGWRYDPPRHPGLTPVADRQVAGIGDALATPGLPQQTLSLLGTPVRPLSVAVLAADAPHLSAALAVQGWTAASAQGPSALIGALNAAVEADADPSVEIAPHFWQGTPETMTLAAPPTVPGTAVFARFWQTAFVTADGLRLFLGSVGSDAVPEPGTPQAGAAPGGTDPAVAALTRALVAAGATDSGRVPMGAQTVQALVLRAP